MCVFYEGWKEFFGIIFFKGNNSVTSNKISPVSADNDEITMRACQNTQYKNIKLVVCPFMDAQRVFHFSVNLTFKSLVGNKYCVYRHK